MILVVDLEIDPNYRYLGPEIAHHLPAETTYVAFVDDPTVPDVEQYDGVVLSGSTASVYADDHDDWLTPATEIVRRCRDARVPLLGVCFGHQLIHQAFGGTVERDTRRAHFVEMESVAEDTILDGVDPVVPVLHADLVVDPASELITTARTSYNEHFCSRHRDAPIWTVQFHPEFTERVRDEPSDWSNGEFDFPDANATKVLENFAAYCTRTTAADAPSHS
ncbi:type 1 glutamine amidotransferase [Halorubrum vacuolatum]|uniref:GMP synthase (Glutamine-hydrolysing) n=1 Tax=Halorubrum vacuolatum TaxID=63740 RepID=A0A238VKI1_HALVU|nr:gamma-glutamyl-gamma-aminobutyrate hydrolase family protein [Halorubrum vacuolatum]SNR34684.1 GMP synthase (glutamine-hydrolysing) [Halorubrum vacuolatum]